MLLNDVYVMRISKLQRKILMIMLRYERGDIPNVSPWCTTDIIREENYGGQASLEIAYLAVEFGGGWTVDRSIRTLVDAGLVNCVDQRQRCLDRRYNLSADGKEMAQKIEKENTKIVDEWGLILKADVKEMMARKMSIHH